MRGMEAARRITSSIPSNIAKILLAKYFPASTVCPLNKSALTEYSNNMKGETKPGWPVFEGDGKEDDFNNPPAEDPKPKDDAPHQGDELERFTN